MRYTKKQDPEANLDISKYAEFLKQKTKEKLIKLLLKEKDIQVPISIFKQELAPLEALVKYLKEYKLLSLKEISIRLDRSIKTIWTTYNNCRDSVLLLESSDYTIPLSIFSHAKLSVLECVVSELRNSHNLTYHEIAVMLNRDDRTIWTVAKRAEKKNG